MTHAIQSLCRNTFKTKKYKLTKEKKDEPWTGLYPVGDGGDENYYYYDYNAMQN
jgi:hypothetical protein